MLDHVLFLNISEVNLFIILIYFIFLLFFSSGSYAAWMILILDFLPYQLLSFFFFSPQNLNVQTCYLLSYGKYIPSMNIY